MPHTEDTIVATDARTLRAIAHPLRARLLTILRVDGPATATELGRRTGESSGATSYHLRQLERYGYVEDEAPRMGRERRWQATTLSTSWEPADFIDDPAGLAVSDALERRQLGMAVRQFETWMARRAAADPRWIRAATMADELLRLTPSQARALMDDLLAAAQRYRTDPPAPEPDEPESLVSVYVQVFPVERAEDLQG